MIAATLILLAGWGLVVLWAAIDRRWCALPRKRMCGTCGYDLAGLEEDAACPECGGRLLKPWLSKRVWAFRPLDRRVLLASAIFAVAFALAAEPLMIRLLMQSYFADGFSPITAHHMVRNVDLGGGPSSGVMALGHFMPITIFVLCSPFIAQISPTRRAWRSWLAWLAAALVTACSCWIWLIVRL